MLVITLSWFSRLVHLIEDHDKFVVAFFTVVLAAATILLFVATVMLWKVTGRAIETAEKTTLTIEAAYVFAGIGGSGPVIDARTGLRWVDPQSGKPVTMLSASAVNYGRTAGQISTIEWGVCLASKLPPVGSALAYRRKVDVGWTIAPGKRNELRLPIMAVSTLKRAHVFYGRVHFTDLVRRRRGISEFMHHLWPDGSFRAVEGRDAYAKTYFLDEMF